jgi:hypothetical protein
VLAEPRAPVHDLLVEARAGGSEFAMKQTPKADA